METSSGVSPDSPISVQRLGKWFGPVATHFIYKWSVGQDQNVMAQLISGIRYFDIRLVSKDGKIHIAHGLYGDCIGNFLHEINAYLNSHPREVVILDFQHFYKFTIHDHGSLSNLIEQTFGNKICRRGVLMRDISLEHMWRHKCQVIAIYRNSFVNYNDLFWPSGSWITGWPNKINTTELLHYLDRGIATRREDVGFVSQGILTPNIKYIITHIGSSLKKLAIKNNSKLTQWLSRQSNGRNGVNVIICDFVETFTFCEKVVSLNYKSLEKSKEINAPTEGVM